MSIASEILRIKNARDKARAQAVELGLKKWNELTLETIPMGDGTGFEPYGSSSEHRVRLVFPSELDFETAKGAFIVTINNGDTGEAIYTFTEVSPNVEYGNNEIILTFAHPQTSYCDVSTTSLGYAGDVTVIVEYADTVTSESKLHAVADAIDGMTVKNGDVINVNVGNNTFTVGADAYALGDAFTDGYYKGATLMLENVPSGGESDGIANWELYNATSGQIMMYKPEQEIYTDCYVDADCLYKLVVEFANQSHFQKFMENKNSIELADGESGDWQSIVFGCRSMYADGNTLVGYFHGNTDASGQVKYVVKLFDAGYDDSISATFKLYKQNGTIEGGSCTHEIVDAVVDVVADVISVYNTDGTQIDEIMGTSNIGSMYLVRNITITNMTDTEALQTRIEELEAQLASVETELQGL